MPDVPAAAAAGPSRRPARRGCRAGWRVRRAKQRGGSVQLTNSTGSAYDHQSASGTGAQPPCRVGCQNASNGAYDRAHLLAVRNRVRCDTASEITAKIWRSLPAHLTSLIRRRTGENQPIRVACGTDRRRGPAATRAADCRQQTRTVPARLSISETPKISPSEKQLVPSIFLTNPTSLNNKLDEVYTKIIKFSPDVVCISEVWQLDDDKARIPGFNFFQRPRLQRRGGGVGCYVKQNIPVKLLGHLSPAEDVEIMWLHIRPKYLPAGSSNICIASVYFPPGARANLRMKYEEHLQHTIDELRTTYSYPRFLICGDFNNFPVASLCQLTGLKQIVTAPTHGASLLDVILTDLDDYYHEPDMLSPSGGSSIEEDKALPHPQSPRSNTLQYFCLQDSKMRCFVKENNIFKSENIFGFEILSFKPLFNPFKNNNLGLKMPR